MSCARQVLAAFFIAEATRGENRILCTMLKRRSLSFGTFFCLVQSEWLSVGRVSDRAAQHSRGCCNLSDCLFVTGIIGAICTVRGKRARLYAVNMCCCLSIARFALSPVHTRDWSFRRVFVENVYTAVYFIVDWVRSALYVAGELSSDNQVPAGSEWSQSPIHLHLLTSRICGIQNLSDRNIPTLVRHIPTSRPYF